MKRVFLLLACFAASLTFGQNPKDALWQSLLANYSARQLGPTIMGGRVTDLAVFEKDPRTFYVASAGGGLWRTDNSGITFRVVFDRESTVSIGAVAVDPNNPEIVYVGTGEGTSRNSVGWGDGIYKSTDGGKTWANIGLKDSAQVHKIKVNPKNPNIVFVAALGRLWGASDERGLYKSSDAGKTWKRVLYVDNKTGASDLIIDPQNPNNMLVSMYERSRKAYTFISGGPGSGLWRSTDGGETWKKVTKGLPAKGFFGRIGMDYFYKNPKIVVATIEHAEYKPRAGGGADERTSESGSYRSKDGGETWEKTSTTNPRPFYFSMPKQDPQDENRWYIPAVSLHYSEDAGKNFRVMRTSVHVDHHAMWINPQDNDHMIIGQDGGVGQTRDRGLTWEHLNNMVLGQFYSIAFDNRKPYWVYGGLQDNGSWGGPTQTSRGGVAFWDWYGIGGGDGFHVQVDPNDWTTVYSESQGGAMQRLDQSGRTPGRSIRPTRSNTFPPLPEGERLRFNWSTPIVLSPHNSKTVFTGAQRLFMSVNRGDTWKVMSPDLTTNDPEKQKAGVGSATPEATGAENHCTITTISESPRQAGIIWAGTDDGNLQITQDGGATWTNVAPNVPDLPKGTWVSRVTASKYMAGRAYATFDGHRSDDNNPYVYVTEDFGKTWTKRNAGIPNGDSAYVIKEGEKNPDLLFLGTEMSLWISLDRGENWSRYRSGGFPTVPVHDVAVQPRDMDLVIGTHGRSIWILPIGALEEMTSENLDKDVVLTKPAPVYNLGRVTGGQQGAWDGDRVYMSPNTQPGTLISYYLKADMTGDAKVKVVDAMGETMGEMTGTAKKGLNVVNWRPGRGQRVAAAGEYRVVLTVGGKEYVTSVKVENASDEGR
ncbi:MAG: hypothetical protein WAO58_07735 [Fimbriimonadaceae bacterium]